MAVDAAVSPLYIFWFLHQTTTVNVLGKRIICCISFDSYIKPQQYVILIYVTLGCISFDSYIKPQLKKIVLRMATSCISFDSYIKPQPPSYLYRSITVVYLLSPTSNHNIIYLICSIVLLYIFWFLHQTTTNQCIFLITLSCISFDSYIKPQHRTCASI